MNHNFVGKLARQLCKVAVKYHLIQCGSHVQSANTNTCIPSWQTFFRTYRRHLSSSQTGLKCRQTINTSSIQARAFHSDDDGGETAKNNLDQLESDLDHSDDGHTPRRNEHAATARKPAGRAKTKSKPRNNDGDPVNNDLDLVKDDLDRAVTSNSRVPAGQEKDLFRLDASGEIEEFLKEQKLVVKRGHTCYITCCPRLGKRKRSFTPEETLYVNSTTGFFECRHCGRRGLWEDLKTNLLVLANVRNRRSQVECLKDVPTVTQTVTQTPSQVVELLQKSSAIDELSEEEFSNIQAMFACQGITRETMRKYGVQYDGASLKLLIPIVSADQVVVGLQVLVASLDDEGQTKAVKTSVVPRDMSNELFGWQTYSDQKQKTVVFTCNIFDAMAITQETKSFALSLARGQNILPQEVLPSLERFSKITLWFGNDMKAWDTVKQFAKKLNAKRCQIIRPNADDPSPLQAVSAKINPKTILKKAQPVVHNAIISFSDIRQEVWSEFVHSETASGVKWKRFPALSKILKGHRRGELTVFTGPTGSGKTTFLAEYSLDLCMQGVNTLWGSFEIKNPRLAQIMLLQYAQKNLNKHIDEFDAVADEFCQLPLHFMTFHGQEDIHNISEAMAHAVYVHDIEHVIIDNLQFMMGMDFNINSKFLKQDQLLSVFRKFATAKNCHVTLVIHPRKERDDEDLMVSSIFGSAKASQESDNILILQGRRSAMGTRKYIQVLKNRFDGELGTMMLKFDKETKSYSVKDHPKKSGKTNVIYDDSSDTADHEP